jgi:hypothetical protein
MAADTNTPILGLFLQGTGNNPNAWGTNLNNSVITPIENAIAGCLTISALTGGAYDLTQANAVYGTIVLEGTLASDLTITVPTTANNWRFINSLTHAGFYVLIKVAGETAVNIPHGKLTEITCDGTDMYRHDRENVGEYFYHAGTTVPGGAIECNGATPLRASAVDLFAEIGTTHGVGNGTTTFTLPDGYTLGKFLRSRTASVTAGTAQTNQNKSHTHTGSGTTATGGVAHTHTFSGTTAAMSANASHSHTVPIQGDEAGSLLSSAAGWGHNNTSIVSLSSTSTNTDHTHTYSGTTSAASATDHTHTYSFTTSTGSADGTEARPENISAVLCIRY